MDIVISTIRHCHVRTDLTEEDCRIRAGLMMRWDDHSMNPKTLETMTYINKCFLGDEAPLELKTFKDLVMEALGDTVYARDITRGLTTLANVMRITEEEAAKRGLHAPFIHPAMVCGIYHNLCQQYGVEPINMLVRPLSFEEDDDDEAKEAKVMMTIEKVLKAFMGDSHVTKRVVILTAHDHHVGVVMDKVRACS